MAVSKTTKARKKAVAATPWYDGTVDVDSLSPNEQVAHRLVSKYRDLAPSVERIMYAEISDDVRTRAMDAFANSIGQIGDPNRDPRVAIDNATRVAGDR